jgi:hypothetical protein
MTRRHFLKQASFAAAAMAAPSLPFTTAHLILIVNSGTRKKEYYEDPTISPNIARLAQQGFVLEQDHSERVASHEVSFRDVLQGLLDHAGDAIVVNGITQVRPTLRNRKPRLIVCRDMAHDVAHESYEQYLHAVKATDAAFGSLFDWVRTDPLFARNTAIVIRPDFGRDDEVNATGQLHHSYGFYYTHRVASIFWGPDFKRGVNSRTVINSTDLAPTVARALNVNLPHAAGRVLSEVFAYSL